MRLSSSFRRYCTSLIMYMYNVIMIIQRFFEGKILFFDFI